ncbi:MAG: sigma-70 family RNA polymerase sigma factor [Dokdonella sp.]|uniref:ECF-type sigma factor n=1 Tax=Dokdonella sp. TaxID=2291710 RepID=UPI0025B8FF42|nr:ECF-type sigma factor [Dokdonella sp.]MBK8123831.1 sigma-70 family RNA polymerase sigma factor [Dokdonella sp.]HNV09039.1 ECF-type sigma factor [Dokdonella sp.]HPW05128.1 ECF-type sigma factor [Dokdonella sp.]
MIDQVPLTAWLRAAGGGDRDAAERAYASIHAELRRLAARQLGRNAGPATLTPTALVNEAYLKLANGRLEAISDRRHFFNLAARAMRQTVIDHARERLAEKRGGQLVRTELDEQLPGSGMDAQQSLALQQALDVLEKQDAELAECLILRAFGGLSASEIAELRGVNERTVNRDLVLARNYLRMVLEPPG